MADQRLPRSSGLEFLADIRQTHPEIVRILFTGFTDIDAVIEAINEGHVYRYIAKPWKHTELKLFVDQAFEHYTNARERDQLVAQLQEANEALERKNTELIEANEELKTLDRVRRVFMEVISHELNTPIAIIIGYVFLLKKEFDAIASPVAIKSIERIEASSKRLKQISDRIFQMIAHEDPSPQLDVEMVNLRDFAIELHQQVAPFLEKRHQKLVSNIELASDEVWADHAKLLDVFTHLTMNAIKFSRDGETIYLRARPAPDNPDEIAISVRDSGIGISEEDLAQVFDLFFSSFETAHHSSGDFEFGKRGMGLGLSIAKRFVEMHSGRIEVHSEQGRGSTFTVYLPRDPAASTSIR